MHVSNDEYLGRRSNYIEDPKIAKENKLKDTSTKEVNNQRIQESVLKIKRELPKVRAQ